MPSSLRIGLIGLDTSHVTAFTQLLNDAADPHHVAGGKVIVAFPGGEASKDFGLSFNRIEGFTKELKEKFGVQIVDSPEAVAEASDLVLLESVDGRVHLAEFRRIAGYRKPTFIDKPLAIKSAEAREIYRLAAESGTPVMSSSAIRYADNLVASLAKSAEAGGGPIIGCDAFGPMHIEPTQPGLFWYGIHTVEAIYTIMGRGCRQVTVASNEGVDLVTGVWADDRVATLRGSRKGHNRFGVTLHREKGFECLDLSGNARPLYASLLPVVIGNLSQGKSPIPPEESIEIIRFIEAANESRVSGKTVTL